MTPLTNQEKDDLARYLSFASRSGGWFLLGMSGFVIAVSAFMVYRTATGAIESDDSLIGGMIALFLAFAVPGTWLMYRRKVIRDMLDGELHTGTGEILESTGPTDTGWHVNLLVKTPDGHETERSLTGYGPPPWKVGAHIDLIFAQDDTKFFPRELSFNLQMGEIPTPTTIDRRKRWGNFVLTIIGLLVLLGFLIGMFSSQNG